MAAGLLSRKVIPLIAFFTRVRRRWLSEGSKPPRRRSVFEISRTGHCENRRLQSCPSPHGHGLVSQTSRGNGVCSAALSRNVERKPCKMKSPQVSQLHGKCHITMRLPGRHWENQVGWLDHSIGAFGKDSKRASSSAYSGRASPLEVRPIDSIFQCTAMMRISAPHFQAPGHGRGFGTST